MNSMLCHLKNNKELGWRPIWRLNPNLAKVYRGADQTSTCSTFEKWQLPAHRPQKIFDASLILKPAHLTYILYCQLTSNKQCSCRREINVGRNRFSPAIATRQRCNKSILSAERGIRARILYHHARITAHQCYV